MKLTPQVMSFAFASNSLVPPIISLARAVMTLVLATAWLLPAIVSFMAEGKTFVRAVISFMTAVMKLMVAFGALDADRDAQRPRWMVHRIAIESLLT